MIQYITLPSDLQRLLSLRSGTEILLTGTIYTARDAAHKRLLADAERGDMPLDFRGAAIYYTGPCPSQPGDVIGACGPTTSGRMDAYTPTLLDMGLKVMIGKGERNAAVTEAMVRNGAVYLAAVGGAGALYKSCVRQCELVCYPELMSEAVYRLEVVDMPLFVAIDAQGEGLYKERCV